MLSPGESDSTAAGSGAAVFSKDSAINPQFGPPGNQNQSRAGKPSCKFRTGGNIDTSTLKAAFGGKQHLPCS